MGFVSGGPVNVIRIGPPAYLRQPSTIWNEDAPNQVQNPLNSPLTPYF